MKQESKREKKVSDFSSFEAERVEVEVFGATVFGI